MSRTSQFDDIARDLAQGELTRRQAVGRLGGAFLGAVLFGASSPGAGAAVVEKNCPPGRQACRGKCCPKGARCKHGKCHCRRGRKRCGKHCVSLQSDAKNCGSCGNACGPGETCVEGTCTSPQATCSDGVKNGAETDVDCGGPDCPGCQNGLDCSAGTDCASGFCQGGVCAQPAPTCSDGIKNEGETDVDCGGPNCPPCATGKACESGTDCVSGTCSGGICVCVLKTCADYPGQCGTLPNGCGGSIVCNPCTGVQTCNAGVCCTPKTCAADYAGQCGTGLTDGCGGTINCNICTVGQTCNAGVCCTPKTCADYPGQCGTALSNGCSGTINCANACGGGQTCSGGMCV
jgi:hypothetical protein